MSISYRSSHNSVLCAPLNPELGKRLIKARHSAQQLIVYRGLLDDPGIRSFVNLLELLTGPTIGKTELLEAYYQFLAALIQAAAPGTWPDAWQRHLANAILSDENAFSRQAEWKASKDLSPSLKKVVRHDLRCLQDLAGIDALTMRTAVAERLHPVSDSGEARDEILDYQDLVLEPAGEPAILKSWLTAPDWGAELESLAASYRQQGTGIFARFAAFRWEKRDGQGQLVGIAYPDPIGFEQLVEYASQKEQLLQNTEYFLSGLPASNVLLYGKRGTGKSSMIKALKQRYASRGLRIIEVAKENLADLPTIISQLRERAFKFIFFIDDLSFEEHEVEYKGLKAVLEGGIEILPQNVLVYTTSNRRHLVKEMFADRDAAAEIHADDTVQEKLSFADRFGLAIFFPSPSQGVYLRMVQAIAAQRGLFISREELEYQALEWARWHNGVSGRTARQFVDQLTAKLNFKANPNQP
jgi:predicted AAA+ superfamily ATPase